MFACIKGKLSVLQLPAVMMETVHYFLKAFGVGIENTAKHLYEESYLQYVRQAVRNDTTYILARSRAQMKKAVTYRVRVYD